MSKGNSTTVRRGTVVKFKHTYGFIQPDDGSPQIFFHYSGIVGGEGKFRSLAEDQVVEFEVEDGKDGRPIATQVRVVQP